MAQRVERSRSRSGSRGHGRGRDMSGHDDERSFESVYDLYCSLSLGEVVKVLQHTQDQAEHKRIQLKTLVTNRYPDLIESADAIVGMEQSVERFKALVEETKRDQQALVEGKIRFGQDDSVNVVTNEPHNPKHEQRNPLQEIEMADYISKAAPRIWEMIDHGELRKAAKLYCESTRIYADLSATTQPPQPQPSATSTVESSPILPKLQRLFRTLRKGSKSEGRSMNTNPTPDSAEEDVEEDFLLDLASTTLGRDAEALPLQPGATESPGMVARYPFLRSHWALIGECQGKIAEACKAVLADQSLSVSKYAGALVAEQVLARNASSTEGDQSPKPIDGALQSFLSSCDEWIQQLDAQTQARNPGEEGGNGDVDAATQMREALHEILRLLQKIVANGAVIFQIQPPAEAILPAANMIFIPQLLQSLGVATEAHSPNRFVEALNRWLDKHSAAITRMIDEQLRSAGSLTDLAVVKETLLIASDFPDWLRVNTAVGVDVFARFFHKPFTDRAHTLSSAFVSQSVDSIISAMDPHVTPSAGRMTAVTRSRTVIELVARLDHELGVLLESVRQLELEGDGLVGTCRSELDRLFLWVSGTCRAAGEGTEVDTLMFARLCEALQCCPHLKQLCADWDDLEVTLTESGMEMVEKWGETLLAVLGPELRRSFEGDSWRFPGSWREMHGGWHEVDVDLDGGDEGANEENEQGVAVESKETISLPTVVSPNVFRFLFAVNGSLGELGDPFTFKSLQQHATSGGADVDGIDAAAMAQLESACLAAFAANNQRCRRRIASIAMRGLVEMLQNMFELDGDAEPTFVNEFAALQTVFDLDWIAMQVGFDDDIYHLVREVKEKLLEVHIDPVNWALYESHFGKSLEHFRARSALFALGALKTKSKDAERNNMNGSGPASETNLVPLKGSIARIPLLPVPSTMRVSRRNKLRKSSSSRRSNGKEKASAGQTKPEMSSEQGSVRDAAIATVTKVGTNILSQYSSYFN